MSDDPLAEWRREINNRADLVTDPEGHRLKLSALAMLAHRRGQVSAEDLNEMLELTDAAKLWALIEWEEAYLIGLFPHDHPDTEEGAQRIKGKG